MCVVSMVTDHYLDTWRYWQLPVGPSRAEFDELKRRVEEMVALLKRAKEYDERTGQPDCEKDDKLDMLRKIASAVGISLDDILAKRAALPITEGGATV